MVHPLNMHPLWKGRRPATAAAGGVLLAVIFASGVRADGQVIGWGEVPAIGAVSAVAAGYAQSCAIQSGSGGNGDVNGDGVSKLLDSVMFGRWLAGYPNP